jgi:hypothetical protein
LRRDIEYIPHIGIGLFVKEHAGYDILDPKEVDFDAKRYAQALREAESLKISCHDTVDRLFLRKMSIKVGASLHAQRLPNDVLINTVSSKEIKL